MNEQTDALAAVRAEQLLADLVGRDAACTVVAAHAVQFEHKGDLRRTVLVGDWEINPARAA